MTEEKEKRLPLWSQYLLMISILLLCIIWGMTSIGKAEYNQQFCIKNLNENGIQVFEHDNAALFYDYKTPYTELDSYRIEDINTNLTTESNNEYEIGCCKVPEGQDKISRSKNCIYTPNYIKPGYNDKLNAFLKRFK